MPNSCRHIIALLAVIVVCSASSAFAQYRAIEEEREPPEPPFKRFHGFYLGVYGGGGNDPFDVDDGTLFSTEVENTGFDNAQFGGIVGYRNQFDSGLVLGVEGNAILGGNSLFSWSGLIGSALGEERKNLVFARVGYAVAAQFSLFDFDDEEDAVESVDLTIGYERSFAKYLTFRFQGTYVPLGEGVSEDFFSAGGALIVQF